MEKGINKGQFWAGTVLGCFAALGSIAVVVVYFSVLLGGVIVASTSEGSIIELVAWWLLLLFALVLHIMVRGMVLMSSFLENRNQGSKPSDTSAQLMVLAGFQLLCEFCRFLTIISVVTLICSLASKNMAWTYSSVSALLLTRIGSFWGKKKLAILIAEKELRERRG
ncbi:MAG: hypothetical protein ACPG32_15865 [Akkermansiaceae bacterium]